MASPASVDPVESATDSAPVDAVADNEAAVADQLAIELAYALPDRQTLLALTVPAGCTAEAAIRRSGMLERHPEIDLAVNPVGIWSRTIALQQPVQAGDRIEIYRPLILDPKTTLRQREKAKRRR